MPESLGFVKFEIRAEAMSWIEAQGKRSKHTLRGEIAVCRCCIRVGIIKTVVSKRVLRTVILIVGESSLSSRACMQVMAG